MQYRATEILQVLCPLRRWCKREPLHHYYTPVPLFCEQNLESEHYVMLRVSQESCSSSVSTHFIWHTKAGTR